MARGGAPVSAAPTNDGIRHEFRFPNLGFLCQCTLDCFAVCSAALLCSQQANRTLVGLLGCFLHGLVPGGLRSCRLRPPILAPQYPEALESWPRCDNAEGIVEISWPYVYSVTLVLGFFRFV